jgi:hypothetical protein
MFDTLSGTELRAVMAEAQRTERVAVARRVLAAGRLYRLMGAARQDAAAARIATELGISRGRAFAEMRCGLQLVDRLPALATVFAAGEVDVRVAAAAAFRTQSIADADLLALIDEIVAGRSRRWNDMSREQVMEAVDRAVASATSATTLAVGA